MVYPFRYSHSYIQNFEHNQWWFAQPLPLPPPSLQTCQVDCASMRVLSRRRSIVGGAREPFGKGLKACIRWCDQKMNENNWLSKEFWHASHWISSIKEHLKLKLKTVAPSKTETWYPAQSFWDTLQKQLVDMEFHTCTSQAWHASGHLTRLRLD